ncbi:MAG: hypothetical protein HY823_04060 [Acidobacteria bacterium]|nr:hypothetical protein [Acidobacteriota bacterium]
MPIRALPLLLFLLALPGLSAKEPKDPTQGKVPQEEGRAAKRPKESEGLRYVIQLRLRGEEKPWETRFTVLPTPPVQSHNKVKKPRLGGWRLVADRSQGTPHVLPFLLGRAERLLYISGPAPQAEAEPFVLRFGAKNCPVWRVQVPPGVKASAYLAELGPNLLAVCDLSAKFERGEIMGIELHLEGIGLKPGIAPPEEGTSLLSTLQRWAATGSAGEGPTGGGEGTE